MEAKKRMELLLHELRLTPLMLAQSLGYPRAQIITNVLSGRNEISRALATNIVKKYPEINYDWLRIGAGSMRGESIAGPVIVGPTINNRLDADDIITVLGITEYEFCKRVGISQSQYRKLSGDTLIKVAQTFRTLNPEWLIGMSTEPLRQKCSRCADFEAINKNLLDLIEVYKAQLKQAKEQLRGAPNRKTSNGN